MSHRVQPSLELQARQPAMSRHGLHLFSINMWSAVRGGEGVMPNGRELTQLQTSAHAH